MGKFYTCTLLILSFLFTARVAHATHAAGGEITYQWLAQDYYRITVKFYRDCGGVPAPDSVMVCVQNRCNNTGMRVVLYPSGPPKEIGAGCPGYPSRCRGGNMRGYEEYIYDNVIELPERCDKWVFFVSINARNNAIGNLAGTGLGSNNLYLESTLDNLNVRDNSSPVFTIPPLTYVCLGSDFTYNNGVVDHDGDFLVFENIPPRTGRATEETCGLQFPNVAPEYSYQPGYRLPDNPFSTKNSYFLDSLTGHIFFRPDKAEVAVVSMRVREFRNGREIGSVVRDIQIVIRNDCYTSPIRAIVDTPAVENGIARETRLEGCVETELRFCIDIDAPMDAAAVLVAKDNHGLSLPGNASVTYQGQASNKIRACVTWTPGLSDTGMHVLLFTVSDSTCRAPGVLTSQVFTVPVYIWPALTASPDTAICPGDTIQLAAAGGWPPVRWAEVSGLAGNSLSCTTCDSPSVYPVQNAVYTVTGMPFCKRGTDTVVVSMLPAPEVRVTPDTIVTCRNHQVQLMAEVLNNPPLPYTLQWSPAEGLTHPGAAATRAVVTEPVTYSVTVRFDNQNLTCATTRRVFIDVLSGFDLLPADTIICAGESFVPRITGDQRYAYRWSPEETVSDPGLMQPLITPRASGSYIVTASYPGCRDSVRSLEVGIQEYPVLRMPADTLVCESEHFRLRPELDRDPNELRFAWSPRAAVDQPDVPYPVFRADSTAVMTLEVQTSAGCNATGSVSVTVVPADFLQVSPDTSICPGDTVSLSFEGPAVSWEWGPPGAVANVHDPAPVVSPGRNTAYYIRAADSHGCRDTQTVTVSVNPVPVLSLPDTGHIFPGESYRMDAGSAYCAQHAWWPAEGLDDPGSTAPLARPDQSVYYYLFCYNEQGCVAQDSIYIKVHPESLVDLPNAFLPGSGLNGRLRPIIKGMVRLEVFAVFNRWGQKIFETTDVHEGWDGTHAGVHQPQGAYVYLIRATTSSGKQIARQGSVTLLR